MDYKGSHGEIVTVNVDRDLWGNPIDRSLPHVVTWYIDQDAEVVNIYPLEEDGYDLEMVLSIQPKKHEVYTKDLIKRGTN